MTKSIVTRERFYRDEDGEITGRRVDEYIGELLITTTDSTTTELANAVSTMLTMTTATTSCGS